MVTIDDRCGWCKHFIKVEEGLVLCDAFPNGKPSDYKFDINKDCIENIHFDVKQDKSEMYNRIFNKSTK